MVLLSLRTEGLGEDEEQVEIGLSGLLLYRTELLPRGDAEDGIRTRDPKCGCEVTDLYTIAFTETLQLEARGASRLCRRTGEFGNVGALPTELLAAANDDKVGLEPTTTRLQGEVTELFTIDTT
ncbi:MAG: hypothetical protein DI537_11375 [Stutzerimonas stutzeri]|nr:MAG: hypothetical protein DI537_11375 [Stutzerimonas stutzeri]